MIVSDYNMPGLDGLELLHFLRDEQIFIPVIWLTGRGSKELFREAWRSGVFDYLEKPVRFQVLKECIKIALDFGHNFNVNRRPMFLKNIPSQKVTFQMDQQLYDQFLNYCQRNYLSPTTMLNQMVLKELEKKAVA